MSLLWIDSFDHYAGPSPNDIAQKYVTVNGTPTISTSTGIRTGRACLLSGSEFGVQKTNSAWAHATVTIGAGVYFATLGNMNLMAVTDGSTTASNANYQVTAYVTSSGVLRVYRGNGTSGTLLDSSTTLYPAFVLQTGVNYYIEMQVVVHASAGSVTLKVDGVTRISVTGVNTKGATNTTCDGFRLSSSSAQTVYYDDLYFTNGAGASPQNGFLGAGRVECLTPSGAGTTTQFTPSAGSNYQNVDDTTPNGDTDYNSSSTTGQIDTFAMSNLSSGTNENGVYGVQVTFSSKTSGANTAKAEIRTNSTNYAGSAQTQTSSYAMYSEMWQTSPYTGSNWPKTDVNAIEAGYKLES